MCVQALGLVAGILSSVVGFAAQMADYNAKAEQWKQNFKNSIKSGEDEHKALDLRMSQENEAFSQKEQQSVIEGAKASAATANSASAAGLSGLSVKNLMADVNRQVALKRVADQTNYKNIVTQLSAEKTSVKTRVENRINSVARPTSPSPLGLVADIAGNVAGSME